MLQKLTKSRIIYESIPVSTSLTIVQHFTQINPSYRVRVAEWPTVIPRAVATATVDLSESGHIGK